MVQWDSVEQLEQYQLHQRNDLPKLGTDSKLLAQFATLHRREKVLDLGCGVGVLGVLLAQRQKELTLDGIDIVPDSAELAAYNLTANGLTGTIRISPDDHNPIDKAGCVERIDGANRTYIFETKIA